jgi:hypothetical protein
MRNELVRLGVAVLLAVTTPALVRGQEPAGNAVEVKVLIRQLKDRDEAVRLKAAKELGKLGRQTREAIAALTDALKDEDADVRHVAKQALEKIQAEVLPALKEKIDVADSRDRELRFKEQIDSLTKQLEQERDRAAKESDVAKAALAEAQRRAAELRALQEKVKEGEAAVLRRTDELRKLRDELVASEILVGSLKERNLELLKEMQRLKADGGKVLPGRGDPSNPPAEKVEGLIQRVDEKSGLITINLGSDAGIAKGHTLEVLRLSPPVYLGRVRVVEVTARTCVAQRIGNAVAARTAFKEGDQVVSSIADGTQTPKKEK